MFMSAMVQIFSWGEDEMFHSTRQIFVPLHEWKKHSLFVLYNS